MSLEMTQTTLWLFGIRGSLYAQFRGNIGLGGDMRTIQHQGNRSREIVPRCIMCQTRTARFHGAKCVSCREKEIDTKAMGGILLIFLVAALLIIGWMSAYGQWVKMH